jgi:hypothetical protein
MPKRTPNPLFEAFKSLFSDAKEKGGINCLYTLVRVSGITNERDPMLVLSDKLESKKVDYRDLASQIVTLEILQNLLNCSLGQPYDTLPFRAIYKKDTIPWTKPSVAEIVSYLGKNLSVANRTTISDLLAKAYSKFDGCIAGMAETGEESDLKDATRALMNIDTITRNIYRIERQKFIGDPNKYFKLPSFEVLEPLVNDTDGVFGFRVHFSNGSNAFFERHPDRTLSMNVMSSESPINFFVGSLDQLKQEWMVGKKRLYETEGILGRYNKIGEWRPMVYPGNPDTIAKASHEMAEGDFEVEGTLFYMMCTGHRVIEFAAKTPIELPDKGVKFGDRFHLWQCPTQEEESEYTLYDGQYDLEAVDPKSIRSAIATINVGINRMALAYNTEVQWSLKYQGRIRHAISKVTPSRKDLKILDSLLKDFPDREDSIILDIAIDWYHRGELTRRTNIFLAFLCYYIALEYTAVAIADGKADLGLGFHSESPEERKKKAEDRIKRKHDELYETDPIEFIKKAYFDDVTGITNKTRRVIEFIFGKEHEYVTLLFKAGKDKESLSDIRGKLAHGDITLLSRDHEKMIEDNLDQMSQITTDFIKKIIYVGVEDKIPTYSGSHIISMLMNDPRITRVTNNSQMIGHTDWTIKSEWIG